MVGDRARAGGNLVEDRAGVLVGLCCGDRTGDALRFLARHVVACPAGDFLHAIGHAPDMPFGSRLRGGWHEWQFRRFLASGGARHPSR